MPRLRPARPNPAELAKIEDDDRETEAVEALTFHQVIGLRPATSKPKAQAAPYSSDAETSSQGLKTHRSFAGSRDANAICRLTVTQIQS